MVFDIYMQATSGTVYLNGADLVLTFNSAKFTSPTCTKGASSTFMLNNTNADNFTSLETSVGSLYRNAVSPAAITANEIIINVNIIGVPDQPTFDSDISKIDNTPYKFGTYTITGITDTTLGGTMDLVWKTSGTGVTTKAYTMATTSDWALTLVTLSTPAITNVALPVEMTSLTGSAQGTNRAILRWSTATETNNSGFAVERRAEGSNAWTQVAFIAGAGTSSSPKEYSYQDTKLAAGVYFYRLKQIDNTGAFKYSSSVEVNVGVAGKVLQMGNYPNPFNPSTEIQFSVPEDGFATLKVFNMLGQEVATLFSGVAKAGHYMSATFNASRFASGVYLSRLEYNGKSMVQRMLLAK
jgi:hypothetical protein